MPRLRRWHEGTADSIPGKAKTISTNLHDVLKPLPTGFLVLRREFLRMNPASAEAHNNLGYVLFQMGRKVEAKEEYEEALRLRPDYETARNNLDRLGKRPED